MGPTEKVPGSWHTDLGIDESRGRAECRSYITLKQQTDDFALQVIFSGQYSDEFERVEGKWRFARRVVKRPFYGDVSAHLTQTFVTNLEV